MYEDLARPENTNPRPSKDVYVQNDGLPFIHAMGNTIRNESIGPHRDTGNFSKCTVACSVSDLLTAAQVMLSEFSMVIQCSSFSDHTERFLNSLEAPTPTEL
jgi:hypothetical protein